MKKHATREESIAAIGNAESFSDVLDLANAALARREPWGDDLAGSKAAAVKWAGFFFPVDCEQGGATLGSIHVDKEEFVALGIRAAKAVSIALLAPLPTLADDGMALDEEAKVANWSKASAAAEKAVKRSLYAGKGTSHVALRSAFGLESLYTSTEQEFESAKHAKDWSEIETLLLAPATVALRSKWDEQVRHAVTQSWEGASAQSTAITEAMGASGAGFVLAGPAGGLGTIAKGASLLAGAYNELAAMAGVPREALNLGMQGLGLNMLSSKHTAYFNPTMRLIAFPVIPSDLGHEWTHLLDHAIGKNGTPAQKRALADLKQAPLDIRPDPALSGQRRAAALAGERESLGWYLESKCRQSSRTSYLEKGSALDGRGSVSSQPLCSEQFMELAKHACSGSIKEWSSFLMEHHDLAKELPNPEVTKGIYHVLMEAWGLDAAATIDCEFIKKAKEHDARSYEKKGYFMSPEELIARIGEAHFTGLGASPSLAWSKGDARTPQGSEAAELSKSYSKLMQAFAAHPQCLAGRGLQKLRDAIKLAKSSLAKSSAVEVSIRNAVSAPPREIDLVEWRSKKNIPGQTIDQTQSP